jgi:Zn-dependent metalloprotease
MNSILVVTITFLVAVIFADSGDFYLSNSVFQGKQLESQVLGKNGNLKFFSGKNIGNFVGEITSEQLIKTYSGLLNLKGTESFVLKRSEVDFKGNLHVVFQQYNRKMEVDGGELIVHLYPSGEVFAVTSSVLPDTIDNKVAIVGSASLRQAIDEDIELSLYASDINVEIEPTLCYLLFEDEGLLVYRTQISYVDFLNFNVTKRSKIYTDAITGHLVLKNPLFMNAKNREVYTANQKTNLPGTLVRKEGQAKVSDPSVNSAYDNSGICYDYYKTTFNRDSFNGKGAKIVSTVHYSTKYNNAFWDGTQMVYGDGDGINFSDFPGDLSVVCHEITHAVTTYTANLRYQGDSGALNEAMSDIFGASSTVYRDKGITQYSWMIGHDCYLAGTALRYMNNPILDGVSYDWFPTRYKGGQDNGGVHWNSGIANLAYVLMVQGGVHPQQKSNNWVQAIGISQAQQIMYSALSQYMTSTSTFAQARAATETAAKVLYGAGAVTSVSGAWTAVGV